MNEKIERLKRLLAFLDSKEFVAPTPLSEKVHERIYKHLANPSVLRDSDVVVVKYEPGSSTISVYTAMESHHNGSLYDRATEEVPVFNDFLDFACDVLANRAYNKADEELKELERQEHDRLVRLRLRDLRLAE